MKIISIWQPWASLIIHRHKFFETRGWPAPRSIIGTRIGIASTKQIRPEQTAAYIDTDFQKVYAETGLGDLPTLPRGCILGTVLLHSCEVMTEEFMEEVTSEEKMFGYWTPGRYAWRLQEPRKFSTPIVVRGAQGIWDWNEHGVIQTENLESPS